MIVAPYKEWNGLPDGGDHLVWLQDPPLIENDQPSVVPSM